MFKEVPVVKEVTREVPVPVEKEVIKYVDVIKEVPVEVVKEVFKEVQVLTKVTAWITGIAEDNLYQIRIILVMV